MAAVAVAAWTAERAFYGRGPFALRTSDASCLNAKACRRCNTESREEAWRACDRRAKARIFRQRGVWSDYSAVAAHFSSAAARPTGRLLTLKRSHPRFTRSSSSSRLLWSERGGAATNKRRRCLGQSQALLSPVPMSSLVPYSVRSLLFFLAAGADRLGLKPAGHARRRSWLAWRDAVQIPTAPSSLPRLFSILIPSQPVQFVSSQTRGFLTARRRPTSSLFSLILRVRLSLQTINISQDEVRPLHRCLRRCGLRHQHQGAQRYVSFVGTDSRMSC